MGMVRQWQELFHGERYSEVDVQIQPDLRQAGRGVRRARRPRVTTRRCRR